jgi:ATP-dependent RNA helicase DeaD
MKSLKRGAHVVIGTPGRIMDHIERGTLRLDQLKTVVLDEADEMLRMGFIDSVKWILDHTPSNRQTALFSATMPREIHRIAQTYLNDPTEVIIKQKTTTNTNIDQVYWPVSGVHKLDALTRILEAEPFDGMIVFVRTKVATLELAEKLEARGFSAAALNGDIPQQQRERLVNQFKHGKFDILIATDVVARGLDVERITHVINYDMPTDPESYTHRIGRTGRAGRNGKAILFVAPREKRMLSTIERATRQKIKQMQLPSVDDINASRIERFKDMLVELAQQPDIDFFEKILAEVEQEHNIPALELAAALAKKLQGNTPFFLEDRPQRAEKPYQKRGERNNNRHSDGMTRYRLNVGRKDGVQPGNIIGAIANETGLPGKFIRNLTIEGGYSLVDLPSDLPANMLDTMRDIWVCGKKLNTTPATGRDLAVHQRGAPRRRSA